MEGLLSQDQWATLVAFRDESARLAGCEWVTAGLPGTYRLLFEPGSSRVEQIAQPSDAAVAQALHYIRPFVLQSERLYFPRVSSNLYQAFTHPHLRRLLAANRAMFDGKAMRDAFVITAHSLELNSATAVDLWVDAFEYHRHGKDAKAKDRFIALHGGPRDDLALVVFQDMLRDKIVAVLNLADFVTGIERSPTFKAALQRGRDGAA